MLLESDAVNGTSPLAVVFVSGNWVESGMVACALDGHDIPALILDDNICRILPTVAFIVGGAKVIVQAENAEEALAVIGLVFPGGPPYAGSFATVGIGGLGFPALLLVPLMWRRRPRIADDPLDDNGSVPT